MSRIAVTGATGHLGRLVVESLLRRGWPADEIVATGRHLDRIDDLAGRGVRTVRADYDDPASLRAAFEGVDRLLFVSGSDVGRRIPQHTAVIDAAKAVGVGQVVYTSAPYATTTSMLLATEHAATEALLHESGLPFTVLRNAWYFENYTAQLPVYQQLGAVHGAAGEGRISGAARADYAEAAAVVLTSADDHVGRVYELGGDTSFSLAELAAEVGRQTSTPVTYQNLSPADFEKVLLEAGLPQPLASVLMDVDRAVAAGELQVDSGDLSRLIGRPTTALSEAVTAAL